MATRKSGRSPNGHIILIEVSPFLWTTGAGVLSWDDDAYELRYGEGKLKADSKSYPRAYQIARSFEQQWEDSIDYWENYINEGEYKQNEKTTVLIVVASVLKKEFFWNNKYLTYGKLICKCSLNYHSILISDNNFGWIVKGG